MRKNQHISPHSAGGWQVKGAGNLKATGVFDTQKEAIERGRTIAINQAAELVVHGRDGRIRQKDSFGNDNFPPRG